MDINIGLSSPRPVESTASWTPYASRYVLPSAIASTLLVAFTVFGRPYIPSLINLAHKHQWIRNQADWLKMTQQIPSYADFATIGSGAVLFNLVGIWRNRLALTETAAQKHFRGLSTDQEKYDFALAQCKDEGKAKEMLSLQMPPPPKDQNALDALYSKLIHLSNSNSPAGVELVIRLGADVNTTDLCKRTPLHWAAFEGNAAAIKALLKAGAKTEAENYNKQTALHWAASHGNAAAIKALLKAGAKTEAEDYNRWTPLHLAASQGNAAAINALLKAGAKTEATDKKGKTPLFFAKTNEIQALFKNSQKQG